MDVGMKLYIDISRKGFSVSRQPGQELGTVTSLLPRTNFNYAGQVNGNRSSIIMACVRWIQRVFPESPMMMEKQETDGVWEQVPGHQLLDLIESPNEYYDSIALHMGTLADYVITGNAYWYKLRSAAGRVVQLWWLPSTTVEPKWPMDGSEFLTHYDYNPGYKTIKLPPEDVIHFRDGFDPQNLRKGLSPLASLFREVFTDDEAANMTASLLRNLGVPGVMIAPQGEVTVTVDEAKLMQDRITERFTGDNRGLPFVSTLPADLKMFGFSPQQMDLKGLRRIPEERICAVIGVPAIVAGLGAGLDRSTYSNFAEAREAAYEGTIIPMHRIISSVIKRQLLIDFEDIVNIWRVGYDLTNVRILQEDKNKQVERINNMVSGGYLKITDAQRLAGVPVDEGEDYYLRPFNVMAIASSVEQLQTETPKLLGITDFKQLDEMTKENNWRQYALKAETYEKPLVKGLQKMFKKQEKEALSNLKGGKTGSLISQIDAEKAYIEMATPILTDLMGQAMADARQLVNARKAEPIVNQAALLWLKTRIGWAAEEISEATAKLLADTLADGYAAGESIPDLSKRVSTVFDHCTRARAQRIARTETIQASAQGAIEGYKDEGVGRLQFYAALDERTCDDCMALHGQEFPIEESTGVITVHPGCRCTWVPLVGV